MKTYKTLWLMVTLALLGAACQLPVQGPSARHTGKGQLTLNMDQKRTVTPFGSESLMDLVSYRLVLTPDGGTALAALTSTTPTFVVPNLAVGKYFLDAEGLNASGTVLAKASGSVVIQADELARVTLTLAAFGSGTLTASVDWSAVPTLATLNTAGQPQLKLTVDGAATAFTQSGLTATYSAAGVSAGAHEVMWQIVNPNTSISWGTKEVFHVYDQKTSTKTWTLATSDLNTKPEYAPVFGITEASPSSVVLNWTNASARVEWFEVERSADSGATWTRLTVSGDQTDTRFIDDLTSLTHDMNYQYRVRGENLYGAGDWSASKTVYVPSNLDVSGADLGNDLAAAAASTVTWSNLHSYTVTSTLLVDVGQTLIIDKGTRIQFQKPATGTYKLLIKGKLIIQGTATEPVVITSVGEATQGAWGLVDIVSSADDATYDGSGNVNGGTQLKFVTIEGNLGLKVDGAYPYLEGVTIQKASAGVVLSSPGADTLKVRGLTIQDSAGNAFEASGTWNLDIRDLNVYRAGKVYLNLYGMSGSGTATIDGGNWKSQNLGYYWYSDSSNYFNGVNLTLKNVKSDGKISLSNTNGTLDNVTLSGAPLLVSSASSSLIVKNSTFTGQTSESYISDSANVEITNVTTSKAQFSGTLLRLQNVNGLSVHHNTWTDNAVTQVLNLNGNSKAILIGNVFDNPDSTYEVNNTGVVGSDVSATYNYWGSNDSAVINGRILDYFDSFENGKVAVTPRLSAEPIANQGFVGLVGPNAGGTASTQDIEFTWKTFGTLSTPKLQVASDQSFTTIIKNQTLSVSDTSYTWSSPPLGKHYWRLTWDSGASASETRELKATILLSTGMNDGVVLSPNRLAWSDPTSSATGYKVTVGTAANLVGATTYTITGATAHLDSEVAGLVDGTKYYWRVTPIRDGHEAPDAPIWNSTARKITKVAAGDSSAFVYNSAFRASQGRNYYWDYALGEGTYGWFQSRDYMKTSVDVKPVKLSVRSGHSLVLDVDSKIWTWGRNSSGQLGRGNSNDTYVVEKLTTPLPALDVGAGYAHSLYVLTNNDVYVMGSNGYGQLGNGTTTDSSSPIKLSGLSATKVAAGGYHTLVLTTDGTVKAWGRGSEGQLGQGDSNDKTSPVTVKKSAVADLTGIVAIAAGSTSSLAIDDAGDLWVWGDYGNNYATKVTGIQAASVTVSQAVAGYNYIVAKTSDNKVWRWSYGSYSMGGDSPTPSLVTGLTGTAVDLAAGMYHALVVNDAGTVFAWGSNTDYPMGPDYSANYATATAIQFNH